MKFLILEPKTKAIAPNIALMKWARWCEQNGYQYQYVRGIVNPDIEPDIILMSCIFSYDSKIYDAEITHYLNQYPDAKLIVGGVFPTLNPKWFRKAKWQNVFFMGGKKRLHIHKGIHPDIHNLIPKYDIEIKSEDELPYKQNRIVTYASRGCVNKCGYCAVPILEGAMDSFKTIKPTLEVGAQELPEAKGVVMYDNNFTEHQFFDDIVDELKDFGLPVDFCQGLHVDSFTPKKAKKLAQLKWKGQTDGCYSNIRFSFDKMSYYNHIKRAYNLILDEGINARMFLYLLYNFKDSPEDFYKRCRLIQDLVDKRKKQITIYAQRFQSYMSLRKNTYTGKHWSNTMLINLNRILQTQIGFLHVSPGFTDKILGRTYAEFYGKLNKKIQ